jgi:hypothetical protein
MKPKSAKIENNIHAMTPPAKITLTESQRIGIVADIEAR